MTTPQGDAVPAVTAAVTAAADIIGIHACHASGVLACCWQPRGCGALAWAYLVLPDARALAAGRPDRNAHDL